MYQVSEKMASYSVPFLFICCCSFLLVSASRSYSLTDGVAVSEPVSPSLVQFKAQKVVLSLYYEALCPYCRNFIIKPLAEMFQTDLISIVDLQLIPWGNANLNPNNTITCQHGEDECYLNTIHACAINIWPDVMKHFSLIKCMEELQHSEITTHGVAPKLSWQLCADKLNLSRRFIEQCYDSGRGRQLLLQFGNKTDHLKPGHQYVPWVVVNGTPLLNDYDNFVHHVCKAYKGGPLPRACSSPRDLVSTSIKKSTEPGGSKCPAINS
ncbi:gamma-interferon-responsive lysosomal thiol protein-like isoform X1 [Mercurialis annua]|uniref:gamma-interferon-responsive lysosomal thiol protein-like isoform X1 n=1 Tax=Mercurialis annua TaxID=3986 RepID=UPI00216100E2|nr:gamma-interferon-responsive lysosomal thiol protein-like isoform X1 [Mercurialis annua]